MITPNAGLSVSRQMQPARHYAQQRILPASSGVVGCARSSEPARPDSHRASGVWQPTAAGGAVTGRDFGGAPACLMRKLRLSAIRLKRRTSTWHPEHKIYLYLLRHKTIDQLNQVWSADITYIPMRRGFCIWLRSSIGRHGGFCRGVCRTP
jgi:transposase InsO family protein